MGIDFSVVIPSHNRIEELILTLTSFELQTYDHSRFEVVVINDGSTDHTDQLLKNYRPSYPFIYKTIRSTRGRCHARNVGIELARGTYIIFCDLDFLVTPDFVETHAKYH
ncbi:glycosyltransferase [Paenibacillus hexagrammi]|uniref:Glycosyltransferase n=1 Tax=Paenibacillus hexagrammi TaxID=2908839 RepID=A0ABY3SC77_9BACL|nr:glycosyltransferase family A protein [Paenibacillus sp. YPD9-1]UJF31541.1 glycosyltransferase [Paenibacillus sp. YPD9-1]